MINEVKKVIRESFHPSTQKHVHLEEGELLFISLHFLFFTFGLTFESINPFILGHFSDHVSPAKELNVLNCRVKLDHHDPFVSDSLN